MRKRIIYGIIKTYKGLFAKQHVGNVQIIILEMANSFWVLNILGKMEDGKYACQMLLRTKSEYINMFIDEFEETENFIQLEEIFCDIPIESEDKFKVIVKKKGKYISSNYIIEFAQEYSQGDIRIYMLDGTLNLVEHDIIKNKVQLKMKALKKQSIFKQIETKFKSLIKR